MMREPMNYGRDVSSIGNLFHGTVSMFGALPLFEEINPQRYSKIFQDPQSELARAGFMPGVIKSLSLSEVKDGTLKDALAEHFDPGRRLPVCVGIGSDGSGKPIRVLSGQYSSTAYPIQWQQFPDGFFSIQKGRTKYVMKIAPQDQYCANVDISVGIGAQILYRFQPPIHSTPVDLGDKHNTSLPPWLSASIWCAAACDVPLDVILEASGRPVKYTDPNPTYVPIDMDIMTYFQIVDSFFDAIYDTDSDSGLDTRGGVAVKVKDVSQPYDYSRIQKMPGEFRLELVKDIIRALHLNGKKDEAQQVTDYYNAHFKKKLGFELEYDHRNDKGSAILAEELQRYVSPRADDIPDHFLELLLESSNGPIVRQIPLESADMEKR